MLAFPTNVLVLLQSKILSLFVETVNEVNWSSWSGVHVKIQMMFETAGRKHTASHTWHAETSVFHLPKQISREIYGTCCFWKFLAWKNGPSLESFWREPCELFYSQPVKCTKTFSKWSRAYYCKILQFKAIKMYLAILTPRQNLQSILFPSLLISDW